MTISRRGFLGTTIAGSLAMGLKGEAKGQASQGNSQNAATSTSGKRPIIVCSGNGYEYLERAFNHLTKGGDTLEAGVLVVTGPEDDPKDDSVGLGGLPNE